MNQVQMALCRVKKDLDERIDDSVLECFCHVETMERDRTAKRAYEGERAGSFIVGRIDSVRTI